MLIEQNFTVDGQVIKKTNQKLGRYTVFEDENDGTVITLYFVDMEKETVEYTMEVYADCGQNIGYVSDYSIHVCK